MTTEAAIDLLRHDPAFAPTISSMYLDEDVAAAAARFARSGEFSEVVDLLGGSLEGRRVLDLGAGTGVASAAFVKAGAKEVIAVEPDPSGLVGHGALRRHCDDLPVAVVSALGERLPLADGSVDVVYCRQVLHHMTDLDEALRECGRVLRPGGAFLATREHVVDDPGQLEEFLRAHPVHQLAGGEGAYSLDEYERAVRGAGLTIRRTFGPWDCVINAFPTVEDPAELRRVPSITLAARFGRLGAVMGRAPAVRQATWRWLRRAKPGRLYSFLAVKPPG
ncbi:MAG: class I SAM-dependent methyltransferase [Actinobacteria bacterium]|nr:class I SAM-dependent methyltransferase [Actinomycetota bacterium]